MKPVSNKVNFPQQEETILEFWRSQKIFEKSVEQRPEEQSFVFYDGPPFATGLPHYGHLLAGTIKDVIPRYKAMSGFRVERRFGWDTHGLPVEYEVEQALNLKGRLDIEAFGVDRFNEECRSIVLRYTKEWRETVERMARWVDFDHDYKTMDRDFMESVWWVFQQLWKKGLIYEGVKVLPYSWRVSTPLSNFEANLNYKDVQDPSVTLKFRAKYAPVKDTFFLAWTTTPWTLPSNLALCVHPDSCYVKLKELESGHIYFLLRSRVSVYFEEGSFEILDIYLGSQMDGMHYEPLFEFAKGHVDTSKTWKVLADEYVTEESGTGMVHQAPAFGEDDLRICQREGIPVFDPVDADGNFCDFMGFIAGMNIKEADKVIIRKLRDEGKLFKQETLQHSYPFCWRTDTPLIYKAISTWFVRVEAIRDLMVANNQKIHWVPEHIKDGRFGKWLDNARDWAISRNRFWGTPLPIWKSKDGDVLCFGSVAELEEACGEKIDDLHKHFVDHLEIVKDGVTYTRVSEVLDCWFESGSMPYAQKHYPFENKKEFESAFPADFICEGLDQTRGWFYTLIVIGTALFDTPAFKNCIVNGLILAEDGKKMSKRLKNYPDPAEMINKYGADAIRLYMLNSAAMRGEDLRFSQNGLTETTASILLPLWNSLAFLSTYAAIDQWEPSELQDSAPSNPLDRWILSRLQALIETVTYHMDRYELNRSVAPFVVFIDLLTNWYIRRSRRRFWKAGHGLDKQEAYATLYQVLLTLSKVIAPFIPYIAEAIYQSLRQENMPESVHLENFPQMIPAQRDVDLEARMDLVLSAVKMGRALRSKHQLKIRQPLSQISLVTRNQQVQNTLEELEVLITEELNIRKVLITDQESELVHLSAKPNFRVLGKRLGKKMKSVAQAISKLDEAALARLENDSVSVEVNGENFDLTQDDLILERTQREGLLVLTENDLTVALNTELDESLLREGLAREFVNKVQLMRKEMDLNVIARIQVYYQSTAKVIEALKDFEDFICTETLAQSLKEETELSEKADQEGQHQATWDLNGESCVILICS